MTRIKNNIQLLVILGLITGIGAEWVRQAQMLPAFPTFANETVYAAPNEPMKLECVDGNNDCYLEVLIEKYANEDFVEKESYYRQLSRDVAIERLGMAVIARQDDGEYMNAMELKYGY